MTAARVYRLEAPDRTGWLFGLGGPQVLCLACGLVVSVLGLSAGAPLAAAAAPFAMAAACALVRVGGLPLVETAVPALGWAVRRAAGRHQWFAHLAAVATEDPQLPPVLAGQVLIAAPPTGWGSCAAGRPVAVVVDRRAGRWAATLRVTGAGFAYAERAEQERLLDAWGDALAPFCRDACPVVAVRWAEWAAPGGIAAHAAWLGQPPLDAEPLVAGYHHLVGAAAERACRHDTLVTVVVGAERAGAGHTRRARDEACLAALASECDLFAARLEAAGLAVAGALSPGEWGWALRAQLDPTALAALEARDASLAALAGQVPPSAAGPLACRAEWGHWRADGSCHRAFWVANWPGTPVGPGWLAGLLLRTGGVRTVALWMEPVDGRVSRRAIGRSAAKLDSDAAQRQRGGFRVGAAHHRAAQAVADREAELVSGFPEFAYTGLVTVTAEDPAALDTAAHRLVSDAAAAGIDLKAIHGRHDQAVAAVVPTARGLAPNLVA